MGLLLPQDEQVRLDRFGVLRGVSVVAGLPLLQFVYLPEELGCVFESRLDRLAQVLRQLFNGHAGPDRFELREMHRLQHRLQLALRLLELLLLLFL